jgi:hypothetical protein
MMILLPKMATTTTTTNLNFPFLSVRLSLLLPLLYHTRREEQNKSIIPKGWKKALPPQKKKKKKKKTKGKCRKTRGKKKRKEKEKKERQTDRQRRCKETKKEMEVCRKSSYYLLLLPTGFPSLSFPQVLVFSFQLNNNNLTLN